RLAEAPGLLAAPTHGTAFTFPRRRGCTIMHGSALEGRRGPAAPHRRCQAESGSHPVGVPNVPRAKEEVVMSLRINSEAPNFTAEPTEGALHFHHSLALR